MKFTDLLNKVTITSILALFITFFVVVLDCAILFLQIRIDTGTSTVIISNVHSIWGVVVAFYFVSSKTSKDKDKQITDLMQTNNELEKK